MGARGQALMTFLFLFSLIAISAASKEDPNSLCTAARAWKFRMAGELDKAQLLLERTLKENTDNGKAFYELARVHFCRIYITMHDVSRSVSQLQTELKQNIALARAAIQKAVLLEPDNARYHYFFGVVDMYGGIGDMHSVWTMPAGAWKVRSTLEHYEKALDIRCDYHEARLMVLGLYDRCPWYLGGDKEKARQYARQLMADDDIWGAYAKCELSENDGLDKVALWQEVVSKHPANADAHEALARVSMDDGELEIAAKEVEKTLEIDPSRNLLLLYMARAYRKTDRLEEAANSLEHFLKYTPKPAGIYRAYALRQLARIKEKQGFEPESKLLAAKADEITKMNIDLRFWEQLDLDKAP